ncbi:hypothetical protein D3C87_2209840 [compost metagenome]
MCVGYYKDKGDYGYFVAPGSPYASRFVSWCDCLGDNFVPDMWKMKQVKELGEEV